MHFLPNLPNVKDLSINSFDKGVITQVKGNIPIFNFEYKLSLKKAEVFVDKAKIICYTIYVIKRR